MQDTVSVVFVVVIAVAFAAQAVILYAMYRATRNFQRMMGSILGDIKRHIEPVAGSINEVISNVRGPVERISVNLAEITQTVHDRAGDADAFVADLLTAGRTQVARVDQLAARLTDRIDETAEVVQSRVLAPLRETAAVVAGVRAALDMFFSRRSRAARNPRHDDELFI